MTTKTPAQIVTEELDLNTEGLVAVLEMLHPDARNKITRAMEGCARQGVTALLNALPTIEEIEALEEQAEESREAESMDAVFEARDGLDDLAGKVRRAMEGAVS